MLEREGMLQVGRKQSTAHFFQSRKEDGFNLLSESEVAQSCPTLCDHMNCSLPGSSIHEIFQARILEWIAISFSKRNYRKKESEVAQSCPTLCDPMDCSLPGSSIHGILQARVLEWVAISFPNKGE